MKIYNKLVRDNIPEIIKEDGKNCDIRVLDDWEYVIELKRKLIEESEELFTAESKDRMIEELADVQEVLAAIIKVENINKDALRRTRSEKSIEKGSYSKRIFLKNTF